MLFRSRSTPGGVSRGVWFALGLLPGAVGVFWLQAYLFGSAFSSGYGSASDLYALENIVPNAAACARRIVQGEPASLAIALLAVAALAAGTRIGASTPGTVPGEWRLRGALWLAAAALAMVLASYLPYFQFAEWSYLRFLLPAWPRSEEHTSELQSH